MPARRLPRGARSSSSRKAPAGRPVPRRNTSSASLTSTPSPVCLACRSHSIPGCSGRAGASCAFPARCGWKSSTRSCPVSIARPFSPDSSTTSRARPRGWLPRAHANSAPKAPRTLPRRGRFDLGAFTPPQDMIGSPRYQKPGGRHMHSRHRCLHALLLASAALFVAAPTLAADVTPDRLANPEAGNWLMNHRTYDAQRYSPLEGINKTNIKGLKLAYAVAIGGTSVNENLESTPLAEDGYLYVVDLWGVVYEIDARSGDMGRIVWRMDPGQEKVADGNRGVALWGNFVISVANHPARLIASNKETGKVAWETNVSDGQNGLQFTAAPLAVKDKIVIGASGGDNGVRTFMLALDAASGKLL